MLPEVILTGHKVKCKPEGSWANEDYPDSRHSPSTPAKSFGFKVFGYKISTSDSLFTTFRIRGISGNILHQIHALCLNTETNSLLKHSGFVTNRKCSHSAVSKTIQFVHVGYLFNLPLNLLTRCFHFIWANFLVILNRIMWRLSYCLHLSL